MHRCSSALSVQYCCIPCSSIAIFSAADIGSSLGRCDSRQVGDRVDCDPHVHRPLWLTTRLSKTRWQRDLASNRCPTSTRVITRLGLIISAKHIARTGITRCQQSYSCCNQRISMKYDINVAQKQSIGFWRLNEVTTYGRIWVCTASADLIPICISIPPI